MKDDFIKSLSSKVENMKNGESLLIFQNDNNTRLFDVCILEKTILKFNLYLIQVNSKNNLDERITLTGLNDNANYLNGFFYSKLSINIKTFEIFYACF